MENQKNNKGVIALLIVIIIILSALCILFATDTIRFNASKVNNKEMNENVSDNNNENISDLDSVTQVELEKIIVDELYIITNRNTGRTTIKSLSDIESYDLETLVINKFNSSDSSLTSITQKEMQDILNETSLSNMSIKFDGTYTKNEYTKRNLYYGQIGAFKTISFNEQDGKYTLSVKYIFIDNGDSGDRGQNGYGNMDDLKQSKNPIVAIYEYDDNFNIKHKIDDMQEYLNSNFDSIKDKLATYTYTFEKQGNKIVLTNLSVD